MEPPKTNPTWSFLLWSAVIVVGHFRRAHRSVSLGMAGSCRASLSANVERTAIIADVLADLEAERLAGAKRTTPREQCVEHAVLSGSFFENRLDSFFVCRRLILMLYHWRVDVLFVPSAWEQLFPFIVDGRSNHRFHDVRVVPNRRGRQFGNVFYKVSHR